MKITAISHVSAVPHICPTCGCQFLSVSVDPPNSVPIYLGRCISDSSHTQLYVSREMLQDMVKAIETNAPQDVFRVHNVHKDNVVDLADKTEDESLQQVIDALDRVHDAVAMQNLEDVYVCCRVGGQQHGEFHGFGYSRDNDMASIIYMLETSKFKTLQGIGNAEHK